MLQVRYFGQIADIVGKDSEEIEMKENSERLILHLIEKYPLLKKYKFQLSLNRKMINKIEPLQLNDEIALLPPFSGG